MSVHHDKAVRRVCLLLIIAATINFAAAMLWYLNVL
jgi:hypothetical protein